MVEIKGLFNTHKSNYSNFYRNPNNIKYIVVHYTGNNADTAYGNATYFTRPRLNASAHYFVDERMIISTVHEENTAWHCGDGHGKHGITNNNSIGIEMCNCRGINQRVIDNTVDLIKWIQGSRFNNRLIIARHYDASKKLCPGIFVDKRIRGFNQAYQDFRNKLSMYRFYN